MGRIKVFVCFCSLFTLCTGAQILAIFPFTAHSHFTMFKAILDGLHGKGHQLTVLSHFPNRNTKINYTDISLVGSTKSLHANMSLGNLDGFSLLDNLNLLHQQIEDYDPILKSKNVQQLIKSNATFDLLITEIFNSDLFLAFAHRFKCPFVTLSPCPLMPWAFKRIGLTFHSTSMPLVFSDRVEPMSYPQMIVNTLEWVFTLSYYKYIMNPKSEEIARKYFDDMPPLEDLAKETSLILVNTHSSLHPIMSSNNRLIEVGGVHIKPEEPLEKGLSEFLNDSKNGVIVFSMGSMFRSETIPKNIFDIFLKVFSKLKQNVIWKWESGNPPKVKNIKFMKWLPQRDVLAHKNVKLFIYHGGLLGTSEAVYCGIPILGLPQFGDMGHNIAALKGAGMSLSLLTLTQDKLRLTIMSLINDKRYKENAMELSSLYRDRPEEPQSKAVFWIEYVIRHNGTKHFVHGSTSPIEIFAVSIFILMIVILFILAATKTALSLIYKKAKKVKVL